jgi:hypothetical protein
MQVLFASVPVANLQVAMDWYELVFGRAPDIVPNSNEVMWRKAISSSTRLRMRDSSSSQSTPREHPVRQTSHGCVPVFDSRSSAGDAHRQVTLIGR